VNRRHEPGFSAEHGKASDPSPVVRTKGNPAANSTGFPLGKSVRLQMEQRFGAEFGAVRVHADGDAARSARSIGAAAYTVGQDIVFGAGRYAPEGDAGRKLLAHELAHVVQQSRGGGASADAEARADVAADCVSQGEQVATDALGSAPISLQAKPDEQSATDSNFAFPPKIISEFALDSAAITVSQLAEIDSLAFGISLHIGMLKNGHARISIVGHTDRSGSEQHNEPLGQGRADAGKQALIDALKKRGIGEDKFGTIESTSMGEASPLVSTADGVKNEKNRRIEINVSVGSQAVASPKPKFDPFAPLDPSILNPPATPPGADPDKGELWRRMEENQKKIDEYDRKHPRTNKSLSEAVIDKVMEEVAEPLIRKLPVSKKMKDLARSGIRKGLEKGVEAACDAAVDASGATGAEAEALKSACKAALKTKVGATP
jgi:outer membrane protein OmpA-like peptidoglycan-associated protein